MGCSQRRRSPSSREPAFSVALRGPEQVAEAMAVWGPASPGLTEHGAQD